MIKNLLFIVLIFMLGISNLRADERSQTVLTRLQTTIKGYNSYRVHFSSSIAHEGQVKGTILVSGKNYLAHVGGQQVGYDGEMLWSYIAADKEAVIERMESSQMGVMSNPQRLLEINPDDYTHRTLESVRNEKSGEMLEVIELKPKGKQVGHFERLVLYVNPKDGIPSRIMIGNEGDGMDLIITRIEGNVPINAGLFRLDLEKLRKEGVEIIDFR